MQWSRLRSQAKAMLAESVRNRVDFHETSDPIRIAGGLTLCATAVFALEFRMFDALGALRADFRPCEPVDCSAQRHQSDARNCRAAG